VGEGDHGGESTRTIDVSNLLGSSARFGKIGPLKLAKCPLCINSGRQAHLGEAFVCNIRGGLIGKIFEVFRQLFLLWLLVLATPWGELPFREAIWPSL